MSHEHPRVEGFYRRLGFERNDVVSMGRNMG
jgi:hypothetical protein